MLSQHLEDFTHRFARWAGSANGFIVALLSVIAWLTAGEICGFSRDWNSWLTIYIGVLTFLMVFLMQRGLNKDLSTLHVKLNELIAATKRADNRLINVEELTEKEISEVQEIHRKIGTEDVTKK